MAELEMKEPEEVRCAGRKSLWAIEKTLTMTGMCPFFAAEKYLEHWKCQNKEVGQIPLHSFAFDGL